MSGEAPPSPEMSISGLTESGLSGKIGLLRSDFPGSAGRCGPPLRRAVSFLGSQSPVSRKSLCAIGHSALWPECRQALCTTRLAVLAETAARQHGGSTPRTPSRVEHLVEDYRDR